MEAKYLKVTATGEVIRADAPFASGGIKYPGGWLARLSDDELSDLGLKPHTPPAAEPISDEERLDRWRARAAMTRAQFCLWAKRAELLTADEAVLAAKGEWPDAFSSALADLPDGMDEVEAKITWAAVSEIPRNDPILAAVAGAAGVTDAQLDAAFGWQA